MTASGSRILPATPYFSARLSSSSRPRRCGSPPPGACRSPARRRTRWARSTSPISSGIRCGCGSPTSSDRSGPKLGRLLRRAAAAHHAETDRQQDNEQDPVDRIATGPIAHGAEQWRTRDDGDLVDRHYEAEREADPLGRRGFGRPCDPWPIPAEAEEAEPGREGGERPGAGARRDQERQEPGNQRPQAHHDRKRAALRAAVAPCGERDAPDDTGHLGEEEKQ